MRRAVGATRYLVDLNEAVHHVGTGTGQRHLDDSLRACAVRQKKEDHVARDGTLMVERTLQGGVLPLADSLAEAAPIPGFEAAAVEVGFFSGEAPVAHGLATSGSDNGFRLIATPPFRAEDRKADDLKSAEETASGTTKTCGRRASPPE